MNRKEDLIKKRAELEGLKDRIAANDAEAIEQGEQLVTEIKDMEAKIKAEDRAAELLKNIGTKGKETMKKEEIMNAHLEDLKNTKGTRTFALKAPESSAEEESSSQIVMSPNIVETDKNPAQAMPQLGVEDLFAAEEISGNALTFFRVEETEGEFGEVGENEQKPRVTPKYEQVTVSLKKVAGYMKETDEVLTDAPFLDSAIRTRGVYDFKVAKERTLIGDLVNTDGIMFIPGGITFDNILSAKQKIRNQTGYAADSIVLNPTDYEALLKMKDEHGQYIMGGPAYGPYGNGAFAAPLKIWGLTAIESTGIAAGTCMVGAFKIGGSVVKKQGEGVRVEVSNSNEDDFIYNRVTIRIEQRMVLAVRIPKAFVKIIAHSAPSEEVGG